MIVAIVISLAMSACALDTPGPSLIPGTKCLSPVNGVTECIVGETTIEVSPVADYAAVIQPHRAELLFDEGGVIIDPTISPMLPDGCVLGDGAEVRGDNIQGGVVTCTIQVGPGPLTVKYDPASAAGKRFTVTGLPS